MSTLINRNKGFTLLETMIAVAVFSFVIALTYTLFTAISGYSVSQRHETIGRQEINNALDLLTKEIALVGYNRNKDDIDVADPATFVFWADIDNNSLITLDNNPSNDQPRVEKITVQWNSGTKELTRSEDQGGTLLLLDTVTAFGIEYFDVDGMQIDEDGNLANGQQITLQKNRDRIRRLRISLTTTPYGDNSMSVSRDISLPNMNVDEMEECGRIAIDSYMTIKACDPPGERGQISVTTYDMAGDRTDDNNIVFTVNPTGSEFEYEDESPLASNTLIGDVRNSRETIYFVPDSTEAGTEYTVSVSWMPPETGCWNRVSNAMMRVVAGDPCGIQFVDAPDEMTACQGDDYDPGVNVVVAVTDTCDNFVPNAVIQVEIEGNDVEGTRGTIEGSPARPEIRSDQFGKAYFKYRPPATVWPESITLKATIVGDLASEECNPEVTHVFTLLSNDAKQLEKYTPPEPISIGDEAVDMAVKLKDSCGNPVEGVTNLLGSIKYYNPVFGNYLTDLQNETNNGVATLQEFDPLGHATPGIYWLRFHPGNGGFTTATIGFYHADLPGGEIDLDYLFLPDSNCDFTLESTPETLYGIGLPFSCDTADMARLHLQGYPVLSNFASFSIESGSGELFLDAAGTVPYTPGTIVELDDEYAIDIYLKNDPENPTAIGSSIIVRGRDYITEQLPGICVQTVSVDIVCSRASLTITNEGEQEVTSANPWDPTLTSAKLVATVADKNLPRTPNSQVTVLARTDTGDEETLTLSNGVQGGSIYSNGTGISFDDLKSGSNPTDENNKLEPDLVGTVWTTYSDPTAQCTGETEVVTVQSPVDGCIDIFAMDFESTPSDTGNWTTSYQDYSSQSHPEWNYQDWQVGYPSGPGPSACPSGRCYGTNLDGAYGADGPGNPQEIYQSRLTRTSTFQVTGLHQAFMFFDIYLDMGSGTLGDQGACAWLERKVNTNSWSRQNHAEYNDKIDASMTSYSNKSCWGGNFSNGEWKHIKYAMTNEVSKKQGDDLSYRFVFLTNDDDYEAKPGMYIDNVRVCGSTRGD